MFDSLKSAAKSVKSSLKKENEDKNEEKEEDGRESQGSQGKREEVEIFDELPIISEDAYFHMVENQEKRLEADLEETAGTDESERILWERIRRWQVRLWNLTIIF